MKNEPRGSRVISIFLVQKRWVRLRLRTSFSHASVARIAVVYTSSLKRMRAAMTTNVDTNMTTNVGKHLTTNVSSDRTSGI